MSDGREPAELLGDIVKAYDIRGVVGENLTAPMVAAVAAAFVDEVGAAGARVVVGHDMRPSSPSFADAFARGASLRGADVIAIGLCSTDQSYFASGIFDAPAAMFTASHNPPQYNGIKLSRAGALGMSLDTGLAAIRDRAAEYLVGGVPPASTPGRVERRDVLADYARHLRSLVPLDDVRPLRVVVDAGNGMAGLTVPAVLGTEAGLEPLPIEVIPLYFELDGSFPNHEANPIVPENIVDLQRAVREHGADLGLAFDGDADRCFVVDEHGDPVGPSAIGAIVAEREIRRALAEHPDRPVSVIHNLITSRFVRETIEAEGAEALRSRVGHSYIKGAMRSSGAVFGAEHSAHYYFRDFWGADNGMLAALHLIAELAGQSEPLSRFAAKYAPYALSGEINSTVDDADGAFARLREAYADRADVDELDGLTFTGRTGDGEAFWWFSVRPSNTEPLLRLNVEAGDRPTMERIRDEVLRLIRA